MKYYTINLEIGFFSENKKEAKQKIGEITHNILLKNPIFSVSHSEKQLKRVKEFRV